MAYRATQKTEARRAARRGEILGAARALLRSGGFAAISIGAVAQRAGVSTGSVYTYFPSKAELCAHTFREAASRELAATRAAADADGNAAGRIAAISESFARRALRAPRLAWALLAEPVDPLVDADRIAFRHAHAEALASVLRAGIASGELPRQSPELTAAATIGALAEAMTGPLSPTRGRVDSGALIGELSILCLRLCGAAIPPAQGAAHHPGSHHHESVR